MSNQQARQEEREMFMGEITRLRERIEKYLNRIEELERERNEYEYQWKRCRREAEERETRLRRVLERERNSKD
jgi:chromosome segregation ATPase